MIRFAVRRAVCATAAYFLAVTGLWAQTTPTGTNSLPQGSLQIGTSQVLGATTGNCLYNNAGLLGQIACGGTAAGLTVGTSAITGGTDTRVLYDNAGVLGEVSPSTTVNGTTCTLGSTCTVAAAAGTLTGNTLAAGVTASSLTSFGASPTLASPAFTGTVTGNGTIPNAVLANSSITIAGKSTALGASYAPARATSTPATPTGTSSLTFVMAGLAGSITPATSGNVLFLANVTAVNNTTGDGCQTQIKYGTGTAPTNGAAVTGTSAGNQSVASAGAVLNYPMALMGYATGLTVSTAYWYDIAFEAVTGGTCTIQLPTLIAAEL